MRDQNRKIDGFFMPPPLGVGGIKFYPCTYVRQFSSKISPLVCVGLIWYLVWSIIMVSCTVSPLFRSFVYLLPVCRAGVSVSTRTRFASVLYYVHLKSKEISICQFKLLTTWGLHTAHKSYILQYVHCKFKLNNTHSFFYWITWINWITEIYLN